MLDTRIFAVGFPLPVTFKCEGVPGGFKSKSDTPVGEQVGFALSLVDGPRLALSPRTVDLSEDAQ